MIAAISHGAWIGGTLLLVVALGGVIAIVVDNALRRRRNTRQLLRDWLVAETQLGCEFFAVRPSDFDFLNDEGRRRAAALGIAWDAELEAASRDVEGDVAYWNDRREAP